MTTEGGDAVAASEGDVAGPGQVVHLEVPVAAAYVGLARAVVASTASAASWLDDERLEDLRLAVSEACTRAVAGHGAGSRARLAVSCWLDGDLVRVEVEDRGGEHPARLPDDDAAWGPQLIRALVDDAAFEATDSGGRVRLTMRRPASP